MNVYDFDGTLYQGDSSVDFIKYCLLTYPKCRKAFPKMLKGLVLFKAKRISTRQFKEIFFSCVSYLTKDELLIVVDDFWEAHKDRIVLWYECKHKKDDLIISASPEFLLNPIATYLNVYNVIGTKINPHTGLIDGYNCKGIEKVRRFELDFPGHQIEEFYSDSFSDEHLAKKLLELFMLEMEDIKNGLFRVNVGSDIGPLQATINSPLQCADIIVYFLTATRLSCIVLLSICSSTSIPLLGLGHIASNSLCLLSA